MHYAFIIIAGFTLASAVAAMSLRNLVHCALCLALTFAGLAALYLQLNAQFIGFAQVLVYIGAVAILILFAVLLTRNTEAGSESVLSRSWLVGLGVALLVFVTLAASILASSVVRDQRAPEAGTTVQDIGEQLMTNYVLPLEVLGLLLTAAMIGAVIIALREPQQNRPATPDVAPLQTETAAVYETTKIGN